MKEKPGISSVSPATRVPVFALRCRGAALLIVTVVIAVAAVLGYAMVSASTLQAMTTGNLRYSATAEYLAESGGQIAIYYLQNPAKYAGLMPNGYYPGQTGLRVATGTTGGSGTVDITVTLNSGTYTIVSVGHADTTNGSSISKTLTATAQIVSTFKVTSAASFLYDVVVPSAATITGDLRCNQKLTLPAIGTHVTGSVTYRTYSGPTIPASRVTVLTSSQTVPIPAYSDVKNYTGTYTYGTKTGTAIKLTNSSLGNTTLPTATDLLTNPAGIYWTDQNLNFTGNVTINGTLILTNGSLKINGAANSITPVTGFPALVVSSDIEPASILAGLVANGLVWTGGGIKTGALLSTMTVNGAYISAGNRSIDTTWKGGALYLNYDASKCNVPDFSAVGATTAGIRLVSWTMS